MSVALPYNSAPEPSVRSLRELAAAQRPKRCSADRRWRTMWTIMSVRASRG